MEIRFKEKNGRVRKGIEIDCVFCKKAFVTRADQPGRYCSTECASEGRKIKIVSACAKCGQGFTRPPSKLEGSKSGLFFCSRQCKDSAQCLGGLKEIQPPHYGTADNYREQFLDEELVCSRCGYKEFSCSIDIHHIDGNHENNVKSNLTPLCRNCHQGYHKGCWS